MLHVIDGVIDFNKGDTVYLSVDLVDGSGETYEMQEGDVLWLTVRELPNADSPILLQAQNIAGEAGFYLSAQETAAVPVGKYSCDIQLQTFDGKTVTVYPELTEEQMGKDNKSWKNLVVNAEVTIP